MNEAIEQALEYVFAGLLFCMGVFLLLWLFEASECRLQVMGKEPERTILFEYTEE